MKRLLILGRQRAGEKNDVKTLALALAEQTGSVEINYGFFEDIVAVISNQSISFELITDNQNLDLNNFDHIILLGWSHSRIYTDLATAIAKFYNAAGAEIWNSELIEARSMTKLSQLVIAAMNNITIAKSVFSMRAELMQAAISGRLQYPLILKDAQASRGRNNYLINSKEQLSQKLPDGNTYLAQQFIENEHFDFRIIVAANRPILCIKRSGLTGSHLNNTSAGGQAELIDLETLPKELIDKSITIAKLFKRELCGVDFIQQKRTGRMILLEVNMTPQLVSGSFVDAKIKALAETISEG